MKYLVLSLLFLAGCQSTMTSGKVRELAITKCSQEPETDMKRMICEYSYVEYYCKLHDPDVKLCAEIQRGR